ncbi:MAG: malonyl-CoA decarboxylase family protein, partial [Pseudomonadota bacterium]
HPRMPDDPIIFVEVALTPDIPSSVDDLLAQAREPAPFEALKTATFYSISNCHPGLAGISFGNALIKQVVRLLNQELPQLDTFVTLSPIPGLSKWADGEQTPDAGMAAKYLTQAKRDDGLPLDAVARFHVGNGALVHAVHEGANSSQAGQKQSFGMMVNYLYDLEKVDENAETYVTTLAVPMSKDIRQLTKA